MTKRMQEFKNKLRENAKNDNYSLAENMGMPLLKKDLDACEKFLNGLQAILKGRYEIVGSCNQDISRYLIPIGTEELITYYGKPDLSFRISDHWNWYSNAKKCTDISYVQCESVDMPSARARTDWHATKPRKGLQVAIQGVDRKYHHVFGYKWNGKEFVWVENDPMDICKLYGLA